MKSCRNFWPRWDVLWCLCGSWNIFSTLGCRRGLLGDKLGVDWGGVSLASTPDPSAVPLGPGPSGGWAHPGGSSEWLWGSRCRRGSLCNHSPWVSVVSLLFWGCLHSGPPTVPPDASSQRVITALSLCRLKCWSCSLGGYIPHVPDLCVLFAGGFSVCASFEQH